MITADRTSGCAIRSLSRSGLRAWVLQALLVILCASVFVWGTQYKVSLYNNGQMSSTGTPEAKLLSEQERPAVSTQADTLAPPILDTPGLDTLFLTFSLGIVGFLLLLTHSSTLSHRQCTMPSAPGDLLGLHAGGTRPPPFLLA